MYYVYLLKDAADAAIGVTDDLATLFHRSPRARYFRFSNRETANNFERYLRSKSGKSFIKSHDFLDLYFLANALEYAHHRFRQLQKMR
jgi:hypothetical protein